MLHGSRKGGSFFSGLMPRSLLRGGLFEAELEETIKRLSSILEPVLVVMIGGIVAIMVMAIFLPIITAIQAFM